MKTLGILLTVVAIALGVTGMLLAKRPVFYSSTAIVKVTRDKVDLPDVTGIAKLATAGSGVGDALFIETEIAVVKSDAILNAVTMQLKLNEAWGERFNGGKALETPQSSQLLRERLAAQPGASVGLVEIKALSEVPAEAAEIANAASHAYCEYRTDYRRRLAQQALDAVAGKYAEAEKQISASRTKSDQAWQQLDPALQELAASNTSTADSLMRALRARLSDSLLRYLAASNQLALFPATNANAEIIEELKARADKAKAELTQAEAATQGEMRRADLLKSYQTARAEFEELTQRFARLKSTVEQLQIDLRPQSQPPASVVEPATASSSPDTRHANRPPWILPAAGVALLLGIGMMFVPSRPKKAAA